MNVVQLTVVVGSVSLLIGLLLFFLSHRHNTLVLSWAFLALSIAIFLFLLYPASVSSGAFFGITVSGAVALFMLIWIYGTKNSREGFKLDETIQKLETEKQSLKNELQDLQQRGTQVLKPIELPNDIPFICQVKGRKGKKIALITGRLEEVKIADVWVSSENTDMQMARFYDRSISGLVRYRGAIKDTSGRVIDDTIARELKICVGNNLPVNPTSVFVTGSGELKNENNVKKIFHVASVRGEPGIGYVPIENIQFCVSNALKVADAESYRQLGIKSILFPLLGAGTARGAFEVIVPKIFQAAISYFKETENSTIENIYFLTRTDNERDACIVEFHKFEQMGIIEVIFEK